MSNKVFIAKVRSFFEHALYFRSPYLPMLHTQEQPTLCMSFCNVKPQDRKSHVLIQDTCHSVLWNSDTISINKVCGADALTHIA
jgi:hypothetical protein